MCTGKGLNSAPFPVTNVSASVIQLRGLPLKLKTNEQDYLMAKKTMKPVAAVLGTAFIAALSQAPAASAAENPFASAELQSGYKLAANHEGKCGEGKCGAEKTKAEGKCGEGKCGAEKTKAEGKCGEGKCGGSK